MIEQLANQLFDVGNYIYALVLMLGVLIFVHELGHFVVAKACGVRVLKFSLGFGPPVGFGRFRMRWVRGHTEYVVAWFPLGGFVKMLGENPGDEGDPEVSTNLSETLGAKPMWQKLAVVFAGPAMNLLLPVAVYTAILAAGLPQANSVIGDVESASPADRAGLRAGDRITAVDGLPVQWWRDLDERLYEKPRGEIALRYERDAVESTVRLHVEPRERPDVFGEPQTLGWLGAYHRRARTIVGVTDRDNRAYRAGLRNGDLIESVAGETVEDWQGFVHAYEASADSAEVAITVKRGAEFDESLELSIPALGDVARLGVTRANVLITHVTDGSPAAAAGLQSGDLVLSVEGRAIGSFDTFAHVVSTSGGRSLSMTISRDSESFEFSVAPKLVDTDVTGIGVAIPRFRIGIAGVNLLGVVGDSGIERVRNPLVSVPRAVHTTIEITRVFLRGLGKLITGDIPRNQIAGPIGIAEMAVKAKEDGWNQFLNLLVLISINLGILNLLPIPILDGGQAVVFLVEGIRRAPLSLRTKEFVQQIGVTVLLLLMGFAFWNDITRSWSKWVDWLTSGL